MTHNFGSVTVGVDSATQVFTLSVDPSSLPIHGCGTTGVMVVSCGWAMMDCQNSFVIVSDTCTNDIMNPGTSCTVTVKANPVATGLLAISLHEECEGGAVVANTTNVGIEVTGVAGTPTPTPTNTPPGPTNTPTPTPTVDCSSHNGEVYNADIAQCGNSYNPGDGCTCTITCSDNGIVCLTMDATCDHGAQTCASDGGTWCGSPFDGRQECAPYNTQTPYSCGAASCGYWINCATLSGCF